MPSASVPAPEPADRQDNDHAHRLLQAMATLAARQGFAATTIADLVAEAGVSKRSFYEQFEDKQACFLALYRAASASALRTLREAVRSDKPWQAQVEQALAAYLSHLQGNPRLVRALFIEVHHLGPAGLAARRQALGELAAFMRETVNRSRRQTGQPLLSLPMALAAVGAINEWVLQALEAGRAERLHELAPQAAQVVRALAEGG